jgi:hypothetical protein
LLSKSRKGKTRLGQEKSHWDKEKKRFRGSRKYVPREGKKCFKGGKKNPLGGKEKEPTPETTASRLTKKHP